MPPREAYSTFRRAAEGTGDSRRDFSVERFSAPRNSRQEGKKGFRTGGLARERRGGRELRGKRGRAGTASRSCQATGPGSCGCGHLERLKDGGRRRRCARRARQVVWAPASERAGLAGAVSSRGRGLGGRRGRGRGRVRGCLRPPPSLPQIRCGDRIVTQGGGAWSSVPGNKCPFPHRQVNVVVHLECHCGVSLGWLTGRCLRRRAAEESVTVAVGKSVITLKSSNRCAGLVFVSDAVSDLISCI